MGEAAGRHTLEADQRQRNLSSPPDLTDYPVREYVAAMAAELAGMARWDGDEKLASALDVAADLARDAAPAV